MDVMEWLVDPLQTLVPVGLSVVGAFLLFGIFTRFAGLRSLSQMTGFDFAVNIATGAMLASTFISPNPTLMRAGFVLFLIFILQIAYAWARRNVGFAANATSQYPHLLWHNGEFLAAHLKTTRFTKDDVYGAIRKAGIATMEGVWCVIAEPGGKLVVWKSQDRTAPTKELFEAVRGKERLGITG